MNDNSQTCAIRLSEPEIEALRWIARKGALLISELDGEQDYGTPSKKTLNALKKAKLLQLSDEDVDPDGFQFTPSIEVTEFGIQTLAALQ